MRSDQALGLRGGRAARRRPLREGEFPRRPAVGFTRVGPSRRSAPADSRSRFVSVVSGKGGVGKSSLVANLAVASAGLGARVLVVDGDLGLANLDLLLGLTPLRNGADWLSGRCSLDEALVRGPGGVDLLPAGSGAADLAALDDGGAARLVSLVADAAAAHDLVLLDVGAGIGPSVVELAASCPRSLLVLTPEPTSLADAYATCKLLWRRRPGLGIDVIVNDAADQTQARHAHRRLEQMVGRFLARDIGLRAVIPHDSRLERAVNEQCAVVERYPRSPCARKLVALAEDLLSERGFAPGGV